MSKPKYHKFPFPSTPGIAPCPLQATTEPGGRCETKCEWGCPDRWVQAVLKLQEGTQVLMADGDTVTVASQEAVIEVLSCE